MALLGIAGAGVALFYQYPGFALLYIAFIAAGHLATPPVLTGLMGRTKDSGAKPGNPQEQKQLQTYRLWSSLKWSLITPKPTWMPFWPGKRRQPVGWMANSKFKPLQILSGVTLSQVETQFTFYIALGAAVIASAFPTTPLGEYAGIGRIADAVGIYIVIMQVSAAFRQNSAPEDAAPSAGFEHYLAMFNNPETRGKAIGAGVAAIIVSGIACLGFGIWATKYDLWYDVYPTQLWQITLGICAVVTGLILHAATRGSALQEWRDLVQARAEWEPRWQASEFKLDTPPRMTSHKLIADMVTVDSFEVPPTGGGASNLMMMTSQLSILMGSGRKIAILEEPDVDVQGQPVPGSMHPLRFRVVCWLTGELPDLSTSDVDPELLNLAVASAFTWAVTDDGKMGRCIPMAIDNIAAGVADAGDQPVWEGEAATGEDMYEDIDADGEPEVFQPGPPPVQRIPGAWASQWAFPDGGQLGYVQMSQGGIGAYLGVEVIVDAKAGVAYFGALTSGAPEFTDPGLAKHFVEMETEQRWNRRWTDILKMGARQPVPQHNVYMEEKIPVGPGGRKETIKCQPMVIPQGVSILEYLQPPKPYEPQLSTTLVAAPFVSITGLSGLSGIKPGDRHQQAIAVYWSERQLPNSPDQVIPSDNNRAAGWLLAALVNNAFDVSRLARPELIDAQPMSEKTSRGHMWKMRIKLYGGVTIGEVRNNQQKIKQTLRSQWLRVADAGEGVVVLVAGVDPASAGFKFAEVRGRRMPHQDYVTSLDWEQAFLVSKVVGDGGKLPVLFKSATLPKNEDVAVLDFELPAGVDPRQIKSAVPALRSATDNSYVDVRPSPNGAKQVRLLVAKNSPLPNGAPVDWEVMEQADGVLPFATGVEGEPVVFNPRETPHVLVAGMSGGGKAQPLSALIPVPVSERFPTGWATNRDLTVGDMVYTANGATTRIIDFSPVTVETAYDITFADGQVVRTGANHLWKVTRTNGLTGAPERGDDFRARARSLRDAAAGYTAGTVASLEAIAQIAGYAPLSLFQVEEIRPLAVKALRPTQKPAQVFDGNAIHAYLRSAAIKRGGTTTFAGTSLTVEMIDKSDLRGQWLSIRDLAELVIGEVSARRHRYAAKSVVTNSGAEARPGYAKSLVTAYPVDEVLHLLADRLDTQAGRRPAETILDTKGIASAKHSYSVRVASPIPGDDVELPVSPGLLGAMVVVEGARITPEYLRASEAQRRELLDSIAAASGFPSDDVVTLMLGDADVAENVTELVRSLGHYATTTGRVVAYSTQTRNRIVDVTEVGTDEMRCIMVEDPEHLYLTHQFIPTHNSVSLQVLLYPAALQGNEIYVVDPTKGGADFGFVKPYAKAFATTVDEAAALMRHLYGEVVRRKELNMTHNVGSYRDLPEEIRPAHVYLLMDEFTSLMQPDPVSKTPSDDPEVEADRLAQLQSNTAKQYIGTMTGKIAREARSAGVTLILATQKLTAKMLDTIPGSGDLKTNLSRMLLGNATQGDRASALKNFTDAPSLGDTIPKGRGLYEGEGIAEIIQVWFEASQETYAAKLAERLTPLTPDEQVDLHALIPKPTQVSEFSIEGGAPPKDDTAAAQPSGEGETIHVIDMGEIEVDFAAFLAEMEAEQEEAVDVATAAVDEAGESIPIPRGDYEISEFGGQAFDEDVAVDEEDEEEDTMTDHQPAVRVNNHPNQLLLLSVDGVIAPLGGNPGDPGYGDWQPVDVPGTGVRGVSRSMLRRIGEMNAKIVWATDWQGDANSILAEAVGRGELPVLTPAGESEYGWWKIDAVLRHLEANPSIRRVLWVDHKLPEEDPMGLTYGELAQEALEDTGVELLLAPTQGSLGLRISELEYIEWWLDQGEHFTAAEAAAELLYQPAEEPSGPAVTDDGFASMEDALDWAEELLPKGPVAPSSLEAAPVFDDDDDDPGFTKPQSRRTLNVDRDL
ncbi:hypothetical protein ASF30_11370 [Leifsonia sp. Leaf264]|nr:hypothetical protein ASF30_11370 [Leifsonia sp. Leaf264]